ncbi:hypothetical protein NDU88_003681 [Pleurodeles waltl]|uniref:Uncharacterized protein n=1 Tax=Pleurodeles waltl TaxID=8319 RepID=A0AAV7WVI5_PLEWA|nr:hypothetical protein NDU88_003681 [Pleurodeles waltl]
MRTLETGDAEDRDGRGDKTREVDGRRAPLEVQTGTGLGDTTAGQEGPKESERRHVSGGAWLSQGGAGGLGVVLLLKWGQSVHLVCILFVGGVETVWFSLPVKTALLGRRTAACRGLEHPKWRPLIVRSSNRAVFRAGGGACFKLRRSRVWDKTSGRTTGVRRVPPQGKGAAQAGTLRRGTGLSRVVIGRSRPALRAPGSPRGPAVSHGAHDGVAAPTSYLRDIAGVQSTAPIRRAFSSDPLGRAVFKASAGRRDAFFYGNTAATKPRSWSIVKADSTVCTADLGINDPATELLGRF